MKRFLLLCLFMLTAFSILAQDIANIFDKITDPIFKEYCQRFDANGDGVLSPDEAATVAEMNILNDGYSPKLIITYNLDSVAKIKRAYIESLDGIEYFTNLTMLNCSGSNITSLDLSKNAKLTRLSCRENKITKLNLENNAVLTNLACGINRLDTLNLSNNTALTELDCCGNQLTELNLTNNTELSILICCFNNLKTLDISNNTRLVALDCSSNKLNSINLSNNTALKNLYCNRNLLRSLDLSNNSLLHYLYCYDNSKLSSIYMWRGFNFDKPQNSLRYIDKDPAAYFKLKP
ncbi:MAG: hypothetical protein LBG19_09150 [Prevotellaceae bacterium]|jgi:Leucine-rich repeat (LRR) protein|nr:hypothetical protein [Prevotellaceae bacterium]